MAFFPGLALLFIAACATDDTSARQSLNPNGDSELALLMRDMYTQGMMARQALLAGKPPTLACDVTRLHTAAATEPEKVARAEYAAFARAFEASVTAMHQSPVGHRDEAYAHMVNSCVECHQALCPGPIRRINKLYLSEKELAVLP